MVRLEKRFKPIKTVLVFFSLFLVCGCGTIIDNTGFVHIEPQHKIYGGTRMEYEALYGAGFYGFSGYLQENYFQVPYMALIDFPMCIVMDSLFLSYTIPYNIIREEYKKAE